MTNVMREDGLWRKEAGAGQEVYQMLSFFGQLFFCLYLLLFSGKMMQPAGSFPDALVVQAEW